MSAKKTIYLHIGTTKTGSTSIQRFLDANRLLLQEKGVALYTGFEKDPAETLRVNRKHAVGVDVSFATPEPEEWVREFLERVRLRPEPVVILTEEVIWFTLFPPRWRERFKTFVEQLQEFAEVRLIVYLRRQDEFWMSSYQECLKHGWVSGRTCQQEMPRKARRYMCYRTALEWVAPIVGRENILVRPFEKRAFAGGDLLQDFLSCVGLELTEEYTRPAGRSNRGLAPFYAEILRCISFFKHGKKEYAGLVRYAFEHPDKFVTQCGGHRFLSPEECRRYLARFEAGNRWVAEELLGRPDGVLFEDPLPAADEFWESYLLNRAEVRDFFEGADFLTEAVRRRMCRQVLSVCGERKPLWMRVRDRSKVELRRWLRKRGFRKWARRLR